MKRVSTCIVVADHQHARFFRNDGPGRGIQAVKELAFDTHLPRTRDLLTDAAGRGASSYDGRRHGMEGNGDTHRQEGRAFIADVATTVGKQMAAHEYDRLILIAPPRALGELRELLPEHVRARVIGELPQDLTKATPDKILSHLSDFIAA